MNYDFNTQFTPEEFEDFGCDIVEVRENIILERFRKFKDLGIDGRNISNNGITIVQCKRIQNIKDLISNLKNEELQKVKDLNPQRYILVLSTDLTVSQKTQIFNLFANYIQSYEDIITSEDIHSYLRKPQYASLVEYYNNLVLSKNSHFTNLVEKITKSTINNKSLLLKEEVKIIKKYFIKTKIYKNSYISLLKNHIVFLSGDAGSGKTTNAKMLLNQLMDEKYIDDIYEVDSYEELTSLTITNNKIGILYDDFWGSTFSDLKLSLNNEKRLQELLQKIETKENIYFILTTREYVLNQGLAFYKNFYNKNLDRRIIHRNCHYTKQEKTKILFAHAKYSDLDFDYLYEIKNNANKIISCNNYSPRSVSFFISKYQDSNLNAKEFIEVFLNYLKNPTDFFKEVFYKLSEGAQVLAFILSISNPEIFVSDLKISFQSISKSITDIKPSLFEDYLHELLDFFLRICYHSPNMIEFTNYSIFDFINSEFSIKIVDYENAFYEGVIYFDQIYNLLIKHQASNENETKLINYLIDKFDKLLIIHDEDNLLIAEDYNDPKKYISHKLWKTIKIAKKTNNEELKTFISNKIDFLIHSYDNKYHSYNDTNFLDIPEIVKCAEEIGLAFSAEEIIDLYLNNFRYLYELHYTNYFPKKYKKVLSGKLKELGNKLNINLEERLLMELGILSYDGISFEYEFTIDEFPNILKILKIPQRKSLIQILEENKLVFSKDYNLSQTNENKTNKSKKDLVDIEIKKFEEELFLLKKLSKNKWKTMIKKSSLNEKNKKILNAITNEENQLWRDLSESSETFATLVLNFYQNEQKNKHLIIPSRKVYSSILDSINDSEIILFIKEYAFYTLKNSFSLMSIKHICDVYKISHLLISEAIQLGILYQNNNLIGFNNDTFAIYLATQYMKENFNSKEEYFDFCLRDGILRADELLIMEEFNAYHFNKLILLPIIENTLKNGINVFKMNILDITREGDSITFSYSNELLLLNDFMMSVLDIDISSDLFIHFNGKNKSGVCLFEYYNQTVDHLFNEHVDELCDMYFSLFQELYEFLKPLKENENLYINIATDGTIMFESC